MVLDQGKKTYSLTYKRTRLSWCYWQGLLASKRFLIKIREDAAINHVNDPNAFIECSNTMDDVYEDIDNHNPKRDKKKSLLFLMT